MPSLSYLLVVLILVSAAPGLVVWWQGRRLVRRAAEDDVVLAERMAAAQRRTGFALFGATLALILLAPRHAIWTLPLMLLLSQSADYPARRRIHGETWTLPAYLSFTLRSMVAIAGFWALLAVTPWIVYQAGAASLAVAVAAAALLTIWLARFPQVFLALLRATPLDDASLAPAFGNVIARASVPMPRLWRSDPRGGLVPTAFALPSLGGGGVLFMQPLLDRLPPDEIGAIFAHEVAHLEQFTPRVLRRGLASGMLLILFGGFLVPVLQSLAPRWIAPSLILWPVVVFIGVRLRARGQQRLETAGDRRAAELCGNPEALASALTRLYALARLPRRLDVDVERWATHPSLARRVQALRASSAAEPAAHEPLRIVAADRRVVAFEPGGVRLQPPAPAAASPAARETAAAGLLPYGDLHELRIQFQGRSPHLIVRDRSGRMEHVPLNDADVAAVHAVLDRVDARLAPDIPRRSAARAGALTAAASAVIALFSPLALLSVFAGAGLAVFAASRSTLAAAAAASLAGAAWAGWAAAGLAAVLTAVMLATCGLVLAWLALRSRPAQRPLERAMAIVAVVALTAATAAVWVLGFVLHGMTAWRLHQAALVSPGTIVLPLALSAALASRSGRARAFAFVPALLAAVALVAASGWFVDAAVRDPLVVSAPRLGEVVARVEERRTVDIPEGGSFELSPGGRWVVRHSYDEGSEAERFALRSVEGMTWVADAADVAFVDDEQIVVAVQGETSVDVIGRRLAPGLPETWRVALRDVFVMELDVAPRDGRWQLTGWGPGGEAVRFDGRVGETHWIERRWPVPVQSPEGMWYIGSGPEALWLARPAQVPAWRQMESVLRAGGHVPEYGADRILLVGADASPRGIASELKLTCVSPPAGQNAVACAAFDGRDTRLYRIGREVAPVGIVPGAVWLMRDHADGTLTAIAGRDYVLIQPSAGRVLRFDREPSPWLELSYAGPLVAFSSIGQAGEELEIGRLEIR